VEGMARVGRGFAQIVSDEREGIEGKVVRMLRGGLSAHVNDYRLEWEGKPREVDAKERESSSAMGMAVDKLKKKISLFDTNVETEAPISFSGLPEFIVPGVVQAPYKLPPLFPYSRYTVYIILSGDVPPPSSLWLRGTTSSGDELALEIPVQGVLETGEAIHKLAARKILQELEEGTGYIHSGKYGVHKKLNPGTFDEWVQREGVRVGVKYGLASKWTSFVAIQTREAVPKETDMDTDSVTELGDDEFEVITNDAEEYGGGVGYGIITTAATASRKRVKCARRPSKRPESGLSSSPPSQAGGLPRPHGGFVGGGLPETGSASAFSAPYSPPGGSFHPNMGSTTPSIAPMAAQLAALTSQPTGFVETSGWSKLAAPVSSVPLLCYYARCCSDVWLMAFEPRADYIFLPRTGHDDK